MKINKNMVAGFVLFLVILINYANIFSNEFVWDDEFFVENNINIRSFENVPEFFSEPSPGNLYRPLRSVFYTVTYSIWELNVFGYHLNSLLLHFFVTLILFFITLKISNKFSFSFVVSLFFAAHPIHTARVTNMTASFDIFGILFLLLSLFFYILHSKNDKRIYYYLSIFVYLFAIFSSEEAITLVLLLGLYDFSFNHKITFQNFKLVLKKYTPYILISIFYVSLRFKVLGQVGRETSYFNESFIGTFLTTFKVFVTYIYLLIFPVNLSIEHSPKFVTTVFDVPFLISLFIILGLIFVLIKSYKKSKLTFFSLGWFFITLIPFS
ncbi:hypothetical protein ISS07_04635, partial [Candidatus Woesearchaeota archaeon]|nr:hypothetical protein [Candidatus Woesearchaeota archaeon]